MFPVALNQYTPPLFFLRDHNGNKVSEFFMLSLPSHLTTITTIFNFNEFIFVYVINIRFICDDEIYLLTYLLKYIMYNAWFLGVPENEICQKKA